MELTVCLYGLVVSVARIRSCIEMGNPKSSVLGVDVDSESTNKRRLRIALMVVIYKGKIVLLGAVFKLIMCVNHASSSAIPCATCT
jgi:hypothetical protein